MKKSKMMRISTIGLSLNYLLKGQLKFLDRYYSVIGVSSDDGNLGEVEQREGIKTINLCMQRNISPLNDLISLFKLFVLFKKEKPKIVHSITPKAGLLSMVAAKMAGVPIRIHTFTGLIFPTKTGMMQKLLILMDRILCYCATHIYPEGEGVKVDLLLYRVTSKPLVILANGNINGIDSQYFCCNNFSFENKVALRKSIDIEEEDFVFVFVGRLVGDKGINELVSAFREVNNHFKNIKLLFVGAFESELDPLLIDTLFEISNNKNIISVGFQKDIRPYFAISDTLIFPSYREGFPNVVLQAGAMGLPSIVSNVNGCNEIIVDGENGIIIPVKNVEAICTAMNKMLSNHHFRAHLLRNARKMIITRYEQEVVWNAILDEYRNIEKNV